MTDSLQQSPLKAEHDHCGAKWTAFGAWNMPVYYQSIMEEHLAVRQRCGLFDISHMAQLWIEGADARAWLDDMFTAALMTLPEGRGRYGFFLNEQGGIIDDLIAYAVGENRFLLIVNASRRLEVIAWLRAHLRGAVTLHDASAAGAGLALQGPHATACLHNAFPSWTIPKRFGIHQMSHGNHRVWICRTGYTGEDGVEIFAESVAVIEIWRALLAQGASPCGLGARDSLRLEMGYPLYGQDLTSATTPLEAQLGSFVALDKPQFIGKSALERQSQDGLQRLLIGLKATEKTPPFRPHYAVLDAEGTAIGELSSGGLSPSLGCSIGMAYLPPTHAEIGQELHIRIRERDFSAVVIKKPFYNPPTSRQAKPTP